MDRFVKSDLEMLMQHGEKNHCISIYMPTQKGRENARENATRFKGLLKKAEEQLEQIGTDTAERRELLEPARSIISESIFWANQSEGLVYFISKDFSRYFRLPLRFEEMAVARNSFHLKPLFGLLSSDGQFYILALSQKNVRLLNGTRSMAEEEDLSRLVEKLEAEFGEVVFEPDLQFHTGAPDSSGTRSAVYHGHGGTIDNYQQERLLNYFRHIDREIQEMLDENKSPLILACVDSLAPLYKEISKYPLVFEESIKGNPDAISNRDLHKKAWDIVSPYFKQKQEEAKARYHELIGTGKTSNNILEILPAAFHGRVSEIFVTPGIQQWGSYNPETEEIHLTKELQSGSDDLIDLAAAKTFAGSGSIHAIDKDQMPDNNPVAAIYRW